jgi:UDP-N-acetylmuramate dehydrogenase
MNIQKNIDLAQYSYMRLGGSAKYFIKANSNQDIKLGVEFAKANKLKLHVLGCGANTVFRDGVFDGLVLHVNNMHKTLDSNILELGAGENWDQAVEYSTKSGLSGLEMLSLIPGSCGAAPVQNIGAYGQQISDVIQKLEVFNIEKMDFEIIRGKDCGFAYRKSRFNTTDKGKYIVTKLWLELSASPTVKNFYPDVRKYIETNTSDINANQNIFSTSGRPWDNANPVEATLRALSPDQLRAIVVDIRTQKLPDPSINPNCGSFFYNPIVNQAQYDNLIHSYPDLKSHKTDDGQLKLYAGQLIELAGFKGQVDQSTGMGTWPTQALVVVNYKAQSTKNLLDYISKIQSTLKTKFGIDLVPEPQII